MQLVDIRIGGVGLSRYFLLLLLVVFIIRIFYLLLLQRTLEKISVSNRAMPATQVWLELIPLVNLVWQFINMENVTKSLEREFYSQEKYGDVKRAASVGKVYCILSCFCYIPLPFIGLATMISSFFCWIVFWVRISNLKNQL